MNRIRDWFTVENFIQAFLVLMFVTVVAALTLLVLNAANAPDVYERIDECVAMEVYTRAECVVIESSR